MSESTPTSAPETATATPPADTTPVSGAESTGARRWWPLVVGLAAFFLVPLIPQVRAFVPIDHTISLFVPALAACAVVGWWAGGRATLAFIWVAFAFFVATQATPGSGGYDSLARGWSLLLAGAFGLTCLVAVRSPFLSRALAAVIGAFGIAFVIGLVGPVRFGDARRTMATELARRDSVTMVGIRATIAAYPKVWGKLTNTVPEVAEVTEQGSQALARISDEGLTVLPALLALESLAALALAWVTYHRLARTRLGVPLSPLSGFRFNDQFVWGLIAGLVLLVLPTLSSLRGLGRNLVLFFGALYAVRGLGVLAWFMAPGALTTTLAIGLVMIWWPVVNIAVFLGFIVLAVVSLGLGLGDTWADWRSRPRQPVEP